MNCELRVMDYEFGIKRYALCLPAVGMALCAFREELRIGGNHE